LKDQWNESQVVAPVKLVLDFDRGVGVR